MFTLKVLIPQPSQDFSSGDFWKELFYADTKTFDVFYHQLSDSYLPSYCFLSEMEFSQEEIEKKLHSHTQLKDPFLTADINFLFTSQRANFGNASVPKMVAGFHFNAYWFVKTCINLYLTEVWKAFKWCNGYSLAFSSDFCL